MTYGGKLQPRSPPLSVSLRAPRPMPSHRLPALAAALLLCACSKSPDPYAVAYARHMAMADAPWSPPTWLPGDDAWQLPELDEVGPRSGPKVTARAAFVYDLDRGEVLYEKRADDRRPVASLTKVVSSLAWASLEPDPDHEACIDYEQRPTRSGARSKLNTGDCATGWDYLGAALVASDNRAAYALGAAADRSVDDLVARMNTISAELGMTYSTWTDPSGLEDDNLSTARDIAKATIALASVPELQLAASATHWDLHRVDQSVRRLNTTNKLSGRQDLEVLAAKTGYTDTAGYCVTLLVRTEAGQRLVITLLGAGRDSRRWDDARRIIDWAERHDFDEDAIADADARDTATRR